MDLLQTAIKVWIAGENQEHYGDYGYNHFIKNIDTIILGNNTYKQIATELSPDEWVYKGLTSYIFTNEKNKDTDDIKFINEDIITFTEKLKKQKGKKENGLIECIYVKR